LRSAEAASGSVSAGLEQISLGQPPRVVGGRPPCPDVGASGAFLFLERPALLLGAGSVAGGADRFAACGDLVCGAGHGDELRRFLGGVAEPLAERVGVVCGRVHCHICLLRWARCGPVVMCCLGGGTARERAGRACAW
jgi:hypothetical protein